MSRVTPEAVRSLREHLGWSAGELGAFFGRTRATIYAWERGSGSPDPTVSALIESLRRETEHRRAHQTRSEYLDWVEALKDESISGYLRRLQTDRNTNVDEADGDENGRDDSPGRVVVSDSEEESGGDPIVYLVPVSADVVSDPGTEAEGDRAETNVDPVSGLVELLLDRLPAVE